MISETMQTAFANCSAYYRDTTLSSRMLDMYRVGILFREPTFCDATYKFGGFAAPHRYLIISSNARSLDIFSQHPEWGLSVWSPGRIFKVLDKQQSAAYVQITLLEIPENMRTKFLHPHLNDLEKAFVYQAKQRFEFAFQTPVLPEHQTHLWLDRVKSPVGIDDAGRFFESWSSGS